MTVDDDCPGEGRCHGCTKWCNRCGDVDQVCDCKECDQHRCQQCRAILDRDEHDFQSGEWYRECRTCYVVTAMTLAIYKNKDEIAAGAAAESEIDAFMRREGYA